MMLFIIFIQFGFKNVLLKFRNVVEGDDGDQLVIIWFFLQF